MRPMVSRSTFSWDHSEASEDITSRRQNRRTKFLITRAPRKRSKRGSYSLKSRLGAECIPFRGREDVIVSWPDYPTAELRFFRLTASVRPRRRGSLQRPRRRLFRGIAQLRKYVDWMGRGDFRVCGDADRRIRGPG